MMRAVLIGAALAAGLPLAASAEAPGFDLPVACTLGQTCYIQNYVDSDPGPGWRDFRCNALTYNTHTGTDFALPTRKAMQAGVAVLAAAPGRVLGVRDGMEDGAFLKDRSSVSGRECGNGVLIDHGQGWHTQYCHMRRGSIAVQKGQRVAAGAPLGLVGLSGKTQFPHLHFSVRHEGETVDPFAPSAAPGTCSAEQAPSENLWNDPAPPYRAAGVLAAGFAPAVPDYATIKAGNAGHRTLPTDAPGLVLWGYAFGGRAGDVLRVEITGPGGFRHAHDATLEKAKVLFFRASGKRRPATGWPPGIYRGEFTLLRAGQPIGQQDATLTISR